MTDSELINPIPVKRGKPYFQAIFSSLSVFEAYDWPALLSWNLYKSFLEYVQAINERK